MIKLGGPKTLPPKIVSYSSYGFQTSDGDWLINVSGVMFQTPPFNLRQKMLIRMLANMMKASDADLQHETFKNRIWPFFVEAEKGQKIHIQIGNHTFRLKKKSRRNGHFDSWVRLSDSLIRQHAVQQDDERLMLSYSLSTEHPKSTPIDCSLNLLEREGLSIVSDIDDTIKETRVTNRRELLMNTFVRDFRSVDGMAAVYRNWKTAGAYFHYVSSSPWQLFEPLVDMQHEFGFPPGSMHLRNFRLRDQLLQKLMFRRKGKAAEIKRLVKNLPARKFVLIGDSGEKDPEIYQKIRRRRPDQIKGVFIREIEGRPMNRERLLKMKDPTADNGCVVFTSPHDLQTRAEPILDRFGKSLAVN